MYYYRPFFQSKAPHLYCWNLTDRNVCALHDLSILVLNVMKYCVKYYAALVQEDSLTNNNLSNNQSNDTGQKP